MVRLADVGPVAAGFWRLALAVPLLGLLAWWQRGVGGDAVRPSWPLVGAIALGGLFFAADIAVWHIGILQTKLANATLFGNFASFLFAIYGFMLLRRFPGRAQTLALLLALLGTFLLLGRSYELSREHEGADVVLFPEYLWMGLEPLTGGGLNGVSEVFWQKLWPQMQPRLCKPGKAAVLGTVPWQEADGTWRNRAPILVDGLVLFQDKLCLTPWEDAFRPGADLHVWELGGLKLAVLICLDVEIPELAALLRGAGIDLLLVPSATETLMGVERIGRCASARAVELGCAVVVAHLVGRSSTSLIDENVGRVSMYLPSQSFTSRQPREQSSAIVDGGFVREDFELSDRVVSLFRRVTPETNPAHLRVEMVTGKQLRADHTTSPSI